MTGTPFFVRPATEEDVFRIAEIHVAAWRETYTEILPPAMLSRLSIGNRAAMWQRALDGNESGTIGIMVAEVGADIMGFGSCGPQRRATLKERGFDGEFYAIYVLRAAQRRGIGTALMGALAKGLSDRGFAGASLWVLRENHGARRFYERIGGEVVGKKEDVRDGDTLHEVAYGWRDLTMLLNPPCRAYVKP
ncbi:MAG: GNAT family N-acetyltransferase [Alphaproteobacteria bacterium]|nr:GNAT family N-acetyltransferase [Alphaproteobacteria bacterium]